MSRLHRTLAIAAAIVVVIGTAIAIIASGDSSADRQDEIARRGAEVMPFDLDKTTHRYIKRSYGGRQIVVADRPDDRHQIELIQQHLRQEARAFARGEFEDPATIHGSQMPGLATLRSAGDKLSVNVEDRPDGAQLTYRTADTAVREALHDWFDAQVYDHGNHAQAR